MFSTISRFFFLSVEKCLYGYCNFEIVELDIFINIIGICLRYSSEKKINIFSFLAVQILYCCTHSFLLYKSFLAVQIRPCCTHPFLLNKSFLVVQILSCCTHPFLLYTSVLAVHILSCCTHPFECFKHSSAA